jgi:simple sugar transport system ATP-binding protein
VTAQPAFELTGAKKRFGGVTALDGASITVAQGTVHALLGENGAGKTTLMRIAFGDIVPDSTELFRVFGVERSFNAPRDAINAGIGMVHQHPHQVASMSVAENVMLGSSGRIRGKQTKALLEALPQHDGFRMELSKPVGSLSVASQQRVEILKAIYHDARLLILDEPTAVLAPDEAEDLYGWLRTFAAGGGTAVVITHRLDEARRFTDDLTVLRNGKTVFTAPSSTATVAALQAVMIGAAQMESERRARTPGPVVARVNDMTIASDGRQWIRSATFEVRAGEILGVAGVEGSGHHQLLHALAGRVFVEGSVDRPSAVALLPEDRHRDAVVLDFDLRENVAIADAGTRAGLIQWNEFRRLTAQLIGTFDVRAVGPEQAMSELSGGNQQKLVFAREVATKPALFIAENPTRGLDIRASAFIRERLQDLADAGCAVIVYSSDLDEVLAIADRVLVVHAGTVKSMAVDDRNAIGAAMLGVA